VVELHGGDPGYMDHPLKIVKPEIGVLVSIGRDHFKAFRNIEEIANEKRKIVDRLPKHGVAVLNRDDPLIRKIGESCKSRIIWVGKEKGSNIQLIESKSDYPEPLTLKIKYDGKLYTIRTGLHGNYLASAVLASVGIGIAANLSIESIIDAVGEVLPVEGRMQPVTTRDGVTFIRDDFKAPYWSVKEPVEFLANARAPRKIAVFGTLSDYSKSASKAYKHLAEFACLRADLVVFVGPHALRALKARKSEDDDNLQAFPKIKDAAKYLKKQLRKGDLVLLKGSSKADHLVQLVLDRDRDVTCWNDQCRLMRFCQNCENVYARSDNSPSTSEVADEMREPLNPIDPRPGSARDCVIIIGLGNTDLKYRNTPHNVGQMALTMLAEQNGNKWDRQPEGDVCVLEKSGSSLILFKPAADVNVSGSVVREFVERQGCTHNDCILIHDDLDLPPGEVKRKTNGGDGGHKGVRSVIMALGTGNFLRIRIGVKQHGGQEAASKYVLRKFDKETDTVIQAAGQRAGEMVEQILSQKSGTEFVK